MSDAVFLNEELSSLRAQVRGLQFDVLGTSILSEISKVVRFSDDFNTVAQHIFLVLELFLGIDSTLIAERRPGRSPALLASRGGLFGEGTNGPIHHALAAVKAAMAGGEPVEMAIYAPRGNLIALPLKVDQETIGCLCVSEPLSLAALGEHRLPLLALVATQIAIVLKNSSLYGSLHEQAEELRQMNTRLIELDRLKSRFLSTMSHELRTPLTVILGNADLLSGSFLGDLNGDQQEAISFIRTSGSHLLGLIEDMLDLSQIEGGLLKLNLRPTPVTECYEKCLQVLRPELEKKKHALDQDIPADLPPVQADPARLEQVLENLLSNAIKFTPSGGNLAFRAEKLETSPLVCIQVTDSGIGIPVEKYPLIFNRFSQVESQDNRRFCGTGLGLSLVRHLVERMGGAIVFASEVGKGSTFSLVLPVAAAATLQAPGGAE